MDKKRFRRIGHQLKPVVTIAAKGLSENVISELERALTDHELIKIRVVAEREDRQVIITDLLEQTSAELVQSIGAVALIYRKAEKQNELLSNLRRQ